jgi:transposase
MNKITVLGIDLAKNVFQLHGIDDQGEVVLRKQLKRKQLLPYLANIPPCLIGIEACGAMHYWCRQFGAHGHTVRAMAPQFVKPYLKSNKNDANDAEAICEAVQRPTMRFCPAKTPEQQTILHLHKSRRLLLRQRIGISNHLRGVLQEYGFVIPRGVCYLGIHLPRILEDGENELTGDLRRLLSTLYEQYQALVERIEGLEGQIQLWHKGNGASQLLASIPGIGVLTATALAGAIGDGRAFRNGRQLAAYFGLVPRQASSGGKDKLLGISKRGDKYIRMLLVHGARSVLCSAKRRDQAGLENPYPWITRLMQRTHANRACIAQANKTARIAWSVLSTGEPYRQITTA